ncbi:cupin [Flavobacteriales bacterium 33_180_T64]|nr:cupin [Flavobacteriales bacterium 33_180_T64]
MIQDISNIPQKELLPGIKARFVHTKNNTIGYVELNAGALLPEHSHIHEQTTQVIEGQLELTVEGVTHTLNPGQVLIIPSNLAHSAKALSFCRVTDVFSPVREDYK